MSKSRKPFTHGVWWRFVSSDGRVLSAWHDAPRSYRSERAARMAAHDLTVFYKGCCEHVVLPLPHHPGVRT